MSHPPNSAASIHCERLTVQFDRSVRAVDQLSLQAPPGEILALIGPSGCGKTTLLRAMAGLENPTGGRVLLDPPAVGQRGEIAFVFQQPCLLRWRTALQNVQLPLELIGRGDAATRRAEAQAMLHSVGLSEAAERTPGQLSGGMQMRVSIARALVTHPRVLLLDEPFAALDDMLRNQLGELLLDLWQQQRFTGVMVTHNIAEAVLLSHRIAVMHSGRVSQTFENPLPRPRDESLRSTAEFGHFYGMVSRSLRQGEALRAPKC